jgi:hypothetical protein
MKALKYIILSLFAAILATILVIIIYFAMSNRSYNTYTVKDVLKSSNIVLMRDKNQIATYGCEIHITGYIDGKARLDLSEYYSEKAQEMNISNRLAFNSMTDIEHLKNDTLEDLHVQIDLSGLIDIKSTFTEQFRSKFYLEYIPENVKEGNLKIEYHFFCM